MMATEVSISLTLPEVTLIILGNEVADFVKEHLAKELKSLPSFKSGDYEQCLKDIYVRTDEMLRTPYGK